MWPFRSIDRTESDRRLSDRLDALERQVESLDVEWTEWYDKYRRLYARIAKRADRDPEAAPESRQDAPGPTKGREAIPAPSPRAARNLRGF